MAHDKKSSYYDYGGIETIDYIKAKLKPEELIGHYKGTLLAYLSRMGLKEGASIDREAEKILIYAKLLYEATHEFRTSDPE